MNRISLLVLNHKDCVHTYPDQRCADHTTILHSGTARQDDSEITAAKLGAQPGEAPAPRFPGQCAGWGCKSKLRRGGTRNTLLSPGIRRRV